MYVAAGGSRTGDGAQQVGIEPAQHHLPVLFDEHWRRRTRVRRIGDRLPVRVVAQSDRHHPHAALPQLLGGLHGKAVMVAAVGEQQHVLEFPHLAVEHVVTHGAQRVADQRSAAADAGHREVLHGHAEEAVIERQGTLDHRAAGEGHQRHPIPRHHLHGIQNRQLDPFQPVRRQILGQHAARHVDHEHHVAPVPFHGGRLRFPAGPRHGDHHCGESQQGQDGEQRARARWRRRPLRGRTEAPRVAPPRAAGQVERRRQRQQQPQQQERLRMDEAQHAVGRQGRHHGLRRRTVALSTAATNMPIPAASAHGTNRSRKLT